ncbi:Mre11 DNA repair/recombination protein [Dorcoceras hygrometricum]|uniref:Double-strand break repair protein MRE11 n=1 Tax=Dorcoceras hygrometricum TaxID=472368 RepID=A0A2Z7CQ94_9LAMI|nr:Mre11 DNA repair/recombination protein [Dorcoceras hygrometricum]
MAESSREDKSNVIRILVATDCHLGYMEKDEIRRHDSFQAFEEICSIAEQKEVDLILLGGDLFHENKPSRSTLVKAIEILRRHCLNDRPVQFQVVSDQTVNFANSFGHVNYEDPHFNVGLPVFSIHGNHDDPAGVDNLSAVDILSACNLVNYFGKMVLEGSGVGQITLCPILMRKGSTSVALYGLGNIRDERLNRMFQTPHAVQWMRPEAQEGCQEVPGMGFHITQPGSSVATSLIDGESKPKHVLLLEVKVVLKDEPDIDANDQNSILEYLDNVVRNLIDKSSQKAINKAEIKLPLVRVKVDYSGFMTINPQRFGQKYVGKVANPQDILIFSKASRRGRAEDKIDDSERLRPEELNQQNIEALVAESNLKMEILPVSDLDVALHNFVNKDDKMAFYSCLQYNLEETRNRIAQDSDIQKFEEEDIIVKERVKERASKTKGSQQFTLSGQTSEHIINTKSNVGSEASFSDYEDATPIAGTKSTRKGKKELSQTFRASHNSPEAGKTTARGRGRGRGKASSTLKQTTLDVALSLRHSRRSSSTAASASVQSLAEGEDIVDSDSNDETEKFDLKDIDGSSDDAQPLQGKGRKRAAPRGRGRGSATASKRGRKSDNSSTSLQRLLTSRDEDDDDDDDDIVKKLSTPQPRANRSELKPVYLTAGYMDPLSCLLNTTRIIEAGGQQWTPVKSSILDFFVLVNCSGRGIMPKVKTNRVKYPEGWELIEPTLRELQAKMREAENDPHDGKRKCEALWPIFKIAHQKSRYIFDLYIRRKEISKELYEFCLDQGYADRNLIAKWKKPGYERLCCLKCIQPRDHNFQTTCVCRVPKHLREEKVIECVHCGCRGCASGD